MLARAVADTEEAGAAGRDDGLNATLDAPSTRTAQESVLFVCHANLARSPLAAALLSAHLRAAGRSDIAVTSAGVRADHGTDRLDEVHELAAECGLDLGSHKPRQLVPELLHDATLVLTMTEEQRAEATRLLPAAVNRTFTMIEFARLLIGGFHERVGSLAELVAAAHRSRASTRPAAEPEDVADPVGHPRSHYERTVIQLDELAKTISGPLRVRGVGKHRAEGTSAR